MSLAVFENLLTAVSFDFYINCNEKVTQCVFVLLQMTHVDVIADKLVCSSDGRTRTYGCMVLMALLHHQPDTCINVLLR